MIDPIVDAEIKTLQARTAYLEHQMVGNQKYIQELVNDLMERRRKSNTVWCDPATNYSSLKGDTPNFTKAVAYKVIDTIRKFADAKAAPIKGVFTVKYDDLLEALEQIEREVTNS